MKILFFLALLVNIIVFLWEYNSGGINSAAIDNTKDKQILLVSELTTGEAKKSLIQAKNDRDSFDSVSFSKVDTISESENEEIDNLVKEPSNLVISKDYHNNIELKTQALVEDKVGIKEPKQSFTNSKADIVAKNKAIDPIHTIGQGQRFVTKEKSNFSKEMIAYDKSIAVSHLVKDTLIQRVASKSKSLINIDNNQSKDDLEQDKTEQKTSKKDSTNKVEAKGFVLAAPPLCLFPR